MVSYKHPVSWKIQFLGFTAIVLIIERRDLNKRINETHNLL